MKNPRILIFGIVMLLLCAVIFFWNTATSQSYKITSLQTGAAIEAVYATAVVEPVIWSAISPLKTGQITEIFVKEGDAVKTGDVLAKLDDADLLAQLREQEALAAFYEENTERAKTLLSNKTISSKEYDQRKTDLTRTNARMEVLQEQIRQMSLIAPTDGIVLWRDVEPGEVKIAGTPLFWVGQPRPLRLKAEIDEEDIPKIRTGQKVYITADAFPDTVFEGTVSQITPKGDPVNKSYRAYIDLPDDTSLMIGMTVETNTVIQEKENARLAPVETLITSQNGKTEIWIVRQEALRNIAQKTSVNTGIRGETHVEILDDLPEGTIVLLPPFAELQDGDSIRIE